MFVCVCFAAGTDFDHWSFNDDWCYHQSFLDHNTTVDQDCLTMLIAGMQPLIKFVLWVTSRLGGAAGRLPPRPDVTWKAKMEKWDIAGNNGKAPLRVWKEGDELTVEWEGEGGVWFSRLHTALKVVPDTYLQISGRGRDEKGGRGQGRGGGQIGDGGG